MADWSPARLLAPLALLATLVGVILVIALSTGSDPSVSLQQTPAGVTTTHTTAAHKPRPRAYVVKAGDSLTAIAASTGVSVPVLERLNPDADPQALRVGEQLKLTP